MKCEELKQLIAAYLDKEVTSEERKQIEAHLAVCPLCRDEYQMLTATRENLRQALRAKAAEAEPPAETWNMVRQRLSTKRPFWEHFRFLTNPAWQAAIPVVMVLIIVGTLWATGSLPNFGLGSAPVPAPTKAPAPTSPVPPPTITIPQPSPSVPAIPEPTPAPVPMPIAPPPFEVAVVPKEAHVLPGEPIAVELSFTNLSANPLVLEQYPFEIQVAAGYQHDQLLYSVDGGTQSLEIPPQATINQSFTWDQTDAAGKQTSPGWYDITFTDIVIRQESASYSFNPGASVLIQYPQGAMEKTFNVEQSVTANGITFQLESVELKSTGITIKGLSMIPGYNLPSGQPGPSPDFWVNAEAEYSIDGGSPKPAGFSGIRFLETGVYHIWDNKLNPVPSDAGELTLRITRLGDQTGPWEFRIPLQ